MAKNIIFDYKCIINAQGIRWAEKFEATSTYNNPDARAKYGLRVVYKGDRVDFHYREEHLRDIQYEALAKAIGAMKSEKE